MIKLEEHFKEFIEKHRRNKHLDIFLFNEFQSVVIFHNRQNLVSYKLLEMVLPISPSISFYIDHNMVNITKFQLNHLRSLCMKKRLSNNIM